MKRILATLFAAVILISLSACNNSSTQNNPNNSNNTSIPSQSEENKSTPSKNQTDERDDTPQKDNNVTVMPDKQSSFETLKENVSNDVENTIASLNEEYEKLVADIDTYDKYFENTDRIEEFYEYIYETSRQLCNRMYSYSINYAELILESNHPNDDKYDDLDMIYDIVYDDACDDIYDEIYDGILDDMYDDFYDGVLDDAYDYVAYRTWSDARSEEYDWWSDTRSDVYKKWSNTRSDIYSFWSDVRSAAYRGDMEKFEKEIADFQEDIEAIVSRDK